MRPFAICLCLGVLLLGMGRAAPAPAAAQPGEVRVYLPLASGSCTGAAICATLTVGPSGICCMGGRPGTVVDVPVTLLAKSGAGLPLEMISDRGACGQTDPIADSSWEPHVAYQIYPTTLAVNWTTFSMRVQLRDSAGNRSPVLCDDVALEGWYPPGAGAPQP